MSENYFLIVANAVQSKGPVPSGLMLEGSAHLAGRLYSEGYMPLVLDFNTPKAVETIAEEGKEGFIEKTVQEIHDALQKTKAKVVGFTLYTNGFKDNIKIAQEVKKRNPQVLIAAGGPQVTYFGEEIFNYTDAFEVLIEGKADTAIVKLADSVYGKRSLNEVPGAIYRTNDGIVRNKRERTIITTLPFPLYDPSIYLAINDKIKVSALRLTEGCRWGRCTFCIQPKIDGRYKERKVEDVLAEIEFTVKNYGIKNFRLADPNPHPEQLKKLFDNLPEEIKISSFAYSDHEYDFSSAKKNLTSLFVGVESMDPNLLLSIKKTKDPQKYVQECEEMITQAQKHGIAVIYANIVPTANDTTERVLWDLENVRRMKPDFITSLPLFPLPNTPLYKQALKRGEEIGLKLDDDYMQRMILFELDLLQPSSQWPSPPWQSKFDGKFVENPFAITGQLFSKPLAEEGIGMVSDEIVLMAYLYHNGLSENQEEKRTQVNEFQGEIREALVNSDHKNLQDIVDRTNSNQ